MYIFRSLLKFTHLPTPRADRYFSAAERLCGIVRAALANAFNCSISRMNTWKCYRSFLNIFFLPMWPEWLFLSLLRWHSSNKLRSLKQTPKTRKTNYSRTVQRCLSTEPCWNLPLFKSQRGIFCSWSKALVFLKVIQNKAHYLNKCQNNMSVMKYSIYSLWAFELWQIWKGNQHLLLFLNSPFNITSKFTLLDPCVP